MVNIPVNGVAIKMITTLTIKKNMKGEGNYDSYLVFNLEKFLHCHFSVLGDPSGSVHTSETAAATVLIEEDVIELDLHEGGAWRQHLIMALSNNAGSERRGRKSASLAKVLYRQQNKLTPALQNTSKNGLTLWSTISECDCSLCLC